MRLFRKIIYIGECDGLAIYQDVTNPRAPLAAPKSPLLNTAASRNQSKQIIVILSALFSIGGLMQLFPATRFLVGYYSFKTMWYFVVIWTLEFILFLAITEHAFYKNVKQAKPTTKANFRKAVNDNLIWNNFSDKKVTFLKKVYAWIITLVVGAVGLGGPFLVLTILRYNMIGTPIGSEAITVSFFGIVTGASVLLIWQNNMIRWFNAVEKYRTRR